MLTDILQALSRAYPDDPSRPGVQLAWLPDDGVYYAAVHRFKKAYGQGKQMVCNVKAPTLEELPEALAAAWRAADPKGARQLQKVQPQQARPQRRRAVQL